MVYLFNFVLAILVDFGSLWLHLVLAIFVSFGKYGPLVNLVHMIHLINMALTILDTLVLKAWENHGKSMEKAWGKFHGFP